jgi:hypothetical protein
MTRPFRQAVPRPNVTPMRSLIVATCVALGSAVPAAAQEPGFTSLFDGTSTAAWRGYRSTTLPAGWQVVDGALTRVSSGGDIVTVKEYGDFELRLEWKVAEGGNSGIFYRVSEEYGAPYESGPEMQVLDDARHADGKSRLTSAGAVFGLYPFPAGVVKPAGEWNEVRLVVRGPQVKHWLNGTKIEYALWTDDWKAKVAGSKFKQWPGYGLSKKGRIALQDHGDRVAYRSIRIRELN